jgi:peptide/nickel transport system substrate-binding protein
MNRFNRLIGLTMALVLVLTLVVGVANAQDETVLVIGMEQEAPNLWPLNTLVFGGVPEQFYARDLWDWNLDREIYPILAESIPTFENGGAVQTADGDTAVTITLKEGLLWSDGEPITTADCEIWHRVRMDPTTSDSVGRASYPDVVKSFEIVDDRTFTITYAGTFPDYLAVSEKPECRYPAHVFGPMLENGGKLEDSPYFTGGMQAVGYGPYILTEWRIGEGMTFDLNPNWQGAAPGFSRVITRLIPDSTQMRNAVEAGEIDVAWNWSDNLQPEYAAIEGVETFNTPAVFSDALWIRTGPNGNNPERGGDALQDPVVRQAIVHALDRLTFAEQLVPPASLFPSPGTRLLCGRKTCLSWNMMWLRPMPCWMKPVG